jgi:hypothetical protein
LAVNSATVKPCGVAAKTSGAVSGPLLASGQTVDAKRKGIGLAPVSMIVGGPLISAGH